MTPILVLLTTLGLLQNAPQGVTRENAVAAVKRFVGDAFIRPTCSEVRDESSRTPLGRLGKHFWLQLETGPLAGSYAVSANTAQVLYMSQYERRTSGPPVLSFEEAKRVAEQFVSTRWGDFTLRNWHLDVGVPESSEYEFWWTEILNNYGALAPWDVTVEVEKATGRVVHYSALPERPILAPTVPRISLERARESVLQWPPYPAASLPFTESRLQVMEDRNGLQWLTWILTHRKPDYETVRYLVDAIDGEVLNVEVPLGMNTTSPGAKIAWRPTRLRLFGITSALPAQVTVATAMAPIVIDGRFWVRAEALRGLGANVDCSSDHPSIVVDNRPLDLAPIYIQKREYGWWVSIREVARRAGWKVAWNPEERAVIVNTRPASK